MRYAAGGPPILHHGKSAKNHEMEKKWRSKPDLNLVNPVRAGRTNGGKSKENGTRIHGIFYPGTVLV